VEKAFRKYLECGIFAHGFARAWCDDCAHDYPVALLLQRARCLPIAQHPAHGRGRGAPGGSCVSTPGGGQWVLSVPKRLRYYLQRDKGALNAALRIFLRMAQQSLQTHCPRAAQCEAASQHLSAVAFIQRLVGVNYLDRSATTIMAGGSGE